MTEAIRVGLLSVDPTDGTSYYRGWGPFSSLQSQGLIQLKELTVDSSWKDIIQLDGVVLQRPFGPPCVNIAHMTMKLGKFLWCDWDDNVFEVPSVNPSVEHFRQMAPTVIDMAQMAGAVTVSTPTLAQVFSQYVKRSDNMFIVPNAVDMDWYSKLKPMARTKEEYRMSVLWRGSASQADEIRHFSSQIEYLIKKYPDVLWIFQGFKPYFLLENLPENSFRFIPWSPIPECFVRQCMVNPDIIAVTLSDARFNRCRSHGAWLEGTMAGAVTVAPNWEEWHRPGTVNYSSPAQFMDRFEELFKATPEQLKELHGGALNEIQEKYTWDVVNEQRKAILKILTTNRSEVRFPRLPR